MRWRHRKYFLFSEYESLQKINKYNRNSCNFSMSNDVTMGNSVVAEIIHTPRVDVHIFAHENVASNMVVVDFFFYGKKFLIHSSHSRHKSVGRSTRLFCGTLNDMLPFGRIETLTVIESLDSFACVKNANFFICSIMVLPANCRCMN